MATVDRPRYGIEVTYTNGTVTKMWFQSERSRDKRHAQLQRDQSVRRAKRVVR